MRLDLVSTDSEKKKKKHWKVPWGICPHNKSNGPTGLATELEAEGMVCSLHSS